jgi:competence ComEA-like helix-hairpin-helix protein
MFLRSLGIGGKKRDLKFWRGQLAQARQELWKCNLDKAGRLFARIDSDLDQQMADSARGELMPIQVETELGIWATRYFRDSTQRALYRDSIAQIEPDARIWFFIAKVFFEQHDTSPDALAAYLSLLQQKPSQKIARQFLTLLSQAEVSEIGLALLEQISALLAEDIEAATLLCKWQLKAHSLNRATEIAEQILDRDPDCLDAHRCFAYVAERSESWETAKHHYRLSQDWLRLAAVCSKAEDILGALEALGSMPESQRDNPTWLYYAGWTSYKQGDIESALSHWQRLQTMCPDSPPALADTLDAVLEQALHECLQNLDLLRNLPPAPQGNAYVIEAHLRLGATELLIHRDPQAADAHLRYAVAHRPEDVVPITYLALCRAMKRQDISFDQAIRRELINRYGDASLFVWLRGLWLVQDDPDLAQRHLARAHSDGIEAHHLPPEAVSATAWLASQLTDQPSPASFTDKGKTFPIIDWPQLGTDVAPFYWAVASSYGLRALQNQSDQSHLFTSEYDSPATSPTSWSDVQAVYYAQGKEWLSALNALADSQNGRLEQAIISQAIQDKLGERDWVASAELVSRGLELDPFSRKLRDLAQELRGPIQQRLWREQAFETLETNLQEQLKSKSVDTQVHHNLALVYTKMAMAEDTGRNTDYETSNGSDCWARAIGHWAVVLSDDGYWEHWREQRSRAYGTEVKQQEIQELRQRSIPELIRKYHDEQQISRGTGPLRNRYRYFGAIVDHEIELTTAIRCIVRAAERQQVELPDPVRWLLSPLLLKEYNEETAGRQTVKLLTNLRVSHYEAQLVRQAFSPLSDIEALVEARQYRMALDKLHTLERETRQDEMQWSEIQRKIAHTLELYTRELVNNGQWDDAINVSREGIRLQPLNAELRQLLVDASVGWANWKIQEGAYEPAVQQLRQTLCIMQVLNKRTVEGAEIKSEIEYLLRANLNRATEDELNGIPGIGSVLARRILEYRDRHGPFTSLAELTEVDGIGPELCERLASYLMVPQVLCPSAVESLPEETAMEIKTILSEALALWGIEAHENDEPETALKRYEEALAFDRANVKACSNAAMIYHNRALAKAQEGRLEEATQDALRAMEYEKDPLTAHLLAAIYRDLAMEASERSHWDKALEYARKVFEYGQMQEHLNFRVAVVCDYAVYLAQHNQYDEAIKGLEAAINLPYDRGVLNVEGLLSGLYTDLGVGLYNTGYVADAVSCWQRAIEYDPGNSVARRNLGLAGGYYR